MEILDLYNINGEKLGKTIERGLKPGEGEYIKLAIVYLKSNGLYLIQKCSKEKGGEYAITGGHVPSGVDSKEQAIIEAKEELGVDLDSDKLEFLGNIYRGHAIFDVYLYSDDSLYNYTFSLQKEEVENVYWLSIEDINKLIQDGVVRASSVEHFRKFINID